MLEIDSNAPKAISAKLQIDGKEVAALVTIFDGWLEVSITSEEYFSVDFGPDDCVSGITTDLKYLCLMNVIVKKYCGRSTNFIGGRSLWSSVLTAQFLAISDCPFSPSDVSISSVYILNDHISQICHNPKTLITIVESEEAIEKLAEKGLIDFRGNEVGWKSEVQVRLDHGNSFEATIERGAVIGSPASPNFSFSTEMRMIDNRYVASIEFSELADFYDVLSKCSSMLRLCEFSYGIEIVLDRLHLTRPEVTRVVGGSQQKFPDCVTVYFFDLGFGTRRTSKDKWQVGRLGDWRDALIAPAKNRSEFENVVKQWFCTEVDRSESRARLLDGFRNGSAFPNDRLIGVCAAFELLPDDAKPDQELPTEVTNLVKGLKSTVDHADFETDWKDRLKQQLGLIKSIRTKDIIQHRLNQIRGSDPAFLPDCELALTHAVKLRNRLIHGSSTKLSEADNSRFHYFFISVLEVIFVFSELIECGYDLRTWNEHHPQGNPLAVTISEFDSEIIRLKEAIGKKQVT